MIVRVLEAEQIVVGVGDEEGLVEGEGRGYQMARMRITMPPTIIRRE